MAGLRAMVMAGMLLVLSCGPSSATSRGFLIEAIREYDKNPTPETKARLERAQLIAMTTDALFYMAPVALIGGMLIYSLSKKRRESRRAHQYIAPDGTRDK